MNNKLEKFKDPGYKPDENTKTEIEQLNKEGQSLSGFQLQCNQRTYGNVFNESLSCVILIFLYLINIFQSLRFNVGFIHNHAIITEHEIKRYTVLVEHIKDN